MERNEIEGAIREEELALEEVTMMLAARTAIEHWPPALVDALAIALDDAGLTRSEIWKVIALRRHLFGPAGLVPKTVTRRGNGASTRPAERLRDGLLATVRSRAGAYLARPRSS